MKRSPSALVVALAAVAAFPAAAHASFAPRVSVNIDPATPHARPAIEATLTETAGDTPPKRFTLSFPRGFTLKHPAGVQTCAAAKRRAGRCSRASEIGSVAALLPTGERPSPNCPGCARPLHPPIPESCWISEHCIYCGIYQDEGYRIHNRPREQCINCGAPLPPVGGYQVSEQHKPDEPVT